MKVIRELTLRPGPSGIQALVSAMGRRMTGKWARLANREKELADRDRTGTVWICCSYEWGKSYPTLWLSMMVKNDGTLKVRNIAPDRVGSITMDEYNAVLKQFVEDVAQSAADEVQATLNLSSDTVTLDDVFTPSVAQALRQFSALANKSTKASHPLDQRRWYSFVIEAHLANASPDCSTVHRLLAEELDWYEEAAQSLAFDYEHERELLKFYDNYETWKKCPQ